MTERDELKPSTERLAMRICASESEIWDEIRDGRRARYIREAKRMEQEG